METNGKCCQSEQKEADLKTPIQLSTSFDTTQAIANLALALVDSNKSQDKLRDTINQLTGVLNHIMEMQQKMGQHIQQMDAKIQSMIPQNRAPDSSTPIRPHLVETCNTPPAS